MKYRGLSATIAEMVGHMDNGDLVDAQYIMSNLNGKYKNAGSTAVISAMRYLSKFEGAVLEPGNLRGTYRVVNAAKAHDAVQEIDNLLDAMAAAEPALRRAKRILSLLENVR